MGKKITNAIQTNGTLLTDEWCRFLAGNKFLVGLSLDGPQLLHDTYRKNKADGPTFRKLQRALKLLKENADLWDTTNPKSNINYHSEFITCLVQNIKNKEVKKTMTSLIESNSMSPSIFAENYRLNVFDCYDDNHFGMLIAFDTYYQYLYDVDFNK